MTKSRALFKKGLSSAQPYASAKLSDENGFLLLNRYRGALMGFAALWIYVYHEWLPISDGHYKTLWVECFIKNLGFGGVDIFLLLSGIGLTYSIGKSKNILSFYYKRIKRILLPYILIAVLHYHFDGWTPAQFWQNILCISFYRTSIHEILWFVPALLTFYLFFPLYYRLFEKASGKVQFTLCAIVIWLVFSLFVRDTMRYDLFIFTNRIPIFVIGILAGWLAQNSNPVFDRLTWKLLALVFFLGLYLSYLCGYKGLYILTPESDSGFPTMFIALSFPFLFARFLSVLGGKRPFRMLGRGLVRLLSFFGMFSFEFYCVQEWISARISPGIPAHYSELTVNIILISVISAAALALYYISKYFWILVEWAARKIHTA